ncbi:dTDP-4-amino-4,6-dideoxygalactose transaminase [Chitinophaga sp. Mgbs1]|uniref:dTDP-4-amino-4,6-dideoxygalactose transaminase n=1 Tax=Chitinophaga solisilvae TaxID=1233460 RepID=A0A3S1CXB1_9BACT|nr:dTDP-4-amino-4,6-dideoxygalactose transaminase [Chitinophaga solisilvae]
MIPFNKPYLTGKEAHYMYQAALSGKLSGNGIFTKKCQAALEAKYGFKKTLLTTSCTDALEMAAILIDTKPGDEIIIPSYTFVSTANPFILRGATVVFADSGVSNPNIDTALLESLITPRTKAIVPVHYAGIACDMEKIMQLADKHGLFVIEDAAQAIDSSFNGRPLGSIGHLAAFSFHETKNIIAGEGGMLAINDDRFVERAEIIWEKGTNRSAFFRGEIDKYGWVDIGSSFLPSEVIAAFLYAQIENIADIQQQRKHLWEIYLRELSSLKDRITLPFIPEYATNNAHMFYIVCQDIAVRQALIAWLKERDVYAVFHYLSLHKSPFYHDKHDGRNLPQSDYYSDRLVRLPLFYELTEEQVLHITGSIKEFFEKN